MEKTTTAELTDLKVIIPQTSPLTDVLLPSDMSDRSNLPAFKSRAALTLDQWLGEGYAATRETFDGKGQVELRVSVKVDDVKHFRAKVEGLGFKLAA